MIPFSDAPWFENDCLIYIRNQAVVQIDSLNESYKLENVHRADANVKLSIYKYFSVIRLSITIGKI